MHVVVWADVATVGVAVHRWEEKCALTLPVLGSDEAGDDGWCAAGCSTGDSLAKYHTEEGPSLLLPVVKWLIAKHPIPLSINGVANSQISEEQARRIVGIEASQFSLVRVAISLAISWDERSVDPVRVACESFLKTDPVCVGSDGGTSFNSLNGIAELVEAGIAGVEAV